jgi:hypothetical protein
VLRLLLLRAAVKIGILRLLQRLQLLQHPLLLAVVAQALQLLVAQLLLQFVMSLHLKALKQQAHSVLHKTSVSVQEHVVQLKVASWSKSVLQRKLQKSAPSRQLMLDIC